MSGCRGGTKSTKGNGWFLGVPSWIPILMLDTPRLTSGSTKAAMEVVRDHFISLGKNNMETVHGCWINDTFLVGILITKYMHIGYLMKNRV